MKKLLFTLALAVALPLHVPIQAKDPLAQAKIEKLAKKWSLGIKETIVLFAVLGLILYVGPSLLKLLVIGGILLFIGYHADTIAATIKKRDLTELKKLWPEVKKYAKKGFTITKSMIDGLMNQGENNEIII